MFDEKIVKDIKRATPKHYSSEGKMRNVLGGLRGEISIAKLSRGEDISQGIYYQWSGGFMELCQRRLAGDTVRAAKTDEVEELRREANDLKEVAAAQTLELRLLKNLAKLLSAGCFAVAGRVAVRPFFIQISSDILPRRFYF